MRVELIMSNFVFLNLPLRLVGKIDSIGSEIRAFAVIGGLLECKIWGLEVWV